MPAESVQQEELGGAIVDLLSDPQRLEESWLRRLQVTAHHRDEAHVEQHLPKHVEVTHVPAHPHTFPRG